MDVNEEESDNLVIPARSDDSGPLGVVFAVSSIAMAGLALLAAGFSGIAIILWPTVGLVVLLALLVGSVGTIATAQQWGASGGYRNYRELRRAVRTRSLPAGADPAWWDSALGREVEAAANERRYSLVQILPTLLFLVLAILDPTRVSLWMVSGLFTAVIVFGLVHARLRVAATAELRAQLSRIEPTTAEPVAQPR